MPAQGPTTAAQWRETGGGADHRHAATNSAGPRRSCAAAGYAQHAKQRTAARQCCVCGVVWYTSNASRARSTSGPTKCPTADRMVAYFLRVQPLILLLVLGASASCASLESDRDNSRRARMQTSRLASRWLSSSSKVQSETKVSAKLHTSRKWQIRWGQSPLDFVMPHSSLTNTAMLLVRSPQSSGLRLPTSERSAASLGVSLALACDCPECVLTMGGEEVLSVGW